jgi:hypothetical protein
MHRGRQIQRQAREQRTLLRSRHYSMLSGKEVGMHRDRQIQRQAREQRTLLRSRHYSILSGKEQGWAKLVLIALERYSVALKRLTFNLR